MRKDELDRQIRQMLRDETRYIRADESMKTLIDVKIEMEEMKMEKRKMDEKALDNNVKAANRKAKAKIWSVKKVAVAAALICLLVPAGLLASGKISYYVSSTRPGEYGESENWNDLKKMEKKVGFKSGLPEKFSNGFAFDNMESTAFDGKDDSGNTLSHTKELMVEYTRGSDERISCFIEKASDHPDSGEEGKRKADDEKTCKDISLKYYVDTYKFVPTDYKLTDEDKEMQKNNPDSFYISYGSDEVEMEEYSHVNWEKDGLSYSLNAFDFDTKMSADELFAMAEEMIR